MQILTDASESAQESHGCRHAALDRVHEHRKTIISCITVYLMMISIAPIATTPYRSDDKLSRALPKTIHGSGLQAVHSSLATIKRMFWPWIHDQGRFFPGSAAWAFSVFALFRSRLSYKIFLTLLAFVMIVLILTLIARLTEAKIVPVLAVALTSTLTLRDWFDGLDTFAGILPLTISLTFACALLIVNGKRWPSAVLAAALWSYALVA